MEMIHRIGCINVDPRIFSVEFVCACDVYNPLFGHDGGLRVYGTQKGLRHFQISKLEEGARNLIKTIQRDLNVSPEIIPGSGAAGGLGAGCHAFLGARLIPGADLILDITRMKSAIHNAKLVITGEGMLDEKTAYGKGIAALAKLTANEQIPLFALVGITKGDIEPLYALGLTACFSINYNPVDRNYMIKHTAENLETAARNLLLSIRDSRGFWR
jgi:glycerate kinase